MIGANWTDPNTALPVQVSTYHGYTLATTAGESIVPGDLVVLVADGSPIPPMDFKLMKAQIDQTPSRIGGCGIAMNVVASGENAVYMTNGFAQVTVAGNRPIAQGDLVIPSGVAGEGHTTSFGGTLSDLTVIHVIGNYDFGTTSVWAKVG